MADDKKEVQAGTQQVMSYLKAQCMLNGFGAMKFPDGEMFMFTREKINELIRAMNEKKTDEIIVFVKSGGVFLDT